MIPHAPHVLRTNAFDRGAVLSFVHVCAIDVAWFVIEEDGTRVIHWRPSQEQWVFGTPSAPKATE